MLKQYEELSVLEQGDDGAVVSIRGQGGPRVLLGPGYIGHIEHIIAKALSELTCISPELETPALRLLCAEMQTLLTTYSETCNKFEGGPPPERAFAIAMEELEQMRKNLQSSR